MSGFGPVVVDTSLSVPAGLPGVSADCAARLTELARREWLMPTPAWAAELEDFLAGHGLPVRDVSTPPRARARHAVCGAVVLLSASAGAALVGAPARPSPAPRVPDVAAVIYGPARPRRAARAPRPSAWRLGPWRGSWTVAEHAGAVEAVRAAIGRGDVYQVNVVGHASADYRGDDPVPALRRLGGLAGARYGGVLRGEGWAVGCASPETLVEVAGGVARTRPIKGTRPATAAGRAELLASPKERAEHVMIVDLSRNDLARVARTGSVRVERLFAVREWAGLWQAESEVSAVLRPGTGLADLLAAVFPGGSVTGAPKLAALDTIHAVEPVGRGPSMGAFGWVGPDRIDLGLTIRTVAADGERLHVWAGGGITWGSDPGAEVAEAAAKAGPLRAALAGLIAF
jgi:para-aminobenzoate synthetase component 1